jgi:hypothetical protein
MLETMDLHNLVLRPNCLLTKYPLVFINGPRSLFYYENLGGNLQDFLEAHGYKVQCPILPFRAQEQRKLVLANWFKQNPSSHYHLVLAKQTRAEFESLFSQMQGLSFTYSDDFATEAHDQQNLKTLITQAPLKYRLHQLFCKLSMTPALDYSAVFPVKTKPVYDRFLDRCVELAENDFI